MPLVINGGGPERSRVWKIEAGVSDFPNGAFVLVTFGGVTKKIVPNQTVVGSTLTLTFTSDPQCEHGSLPDGVFYVLPVNGHGHRLFGDANSDGTVDSTDFLDFSNAFGTSEGDPQYRSDLDHNQDGVIDSTDYLEFANRYGLTV